MGRITRKARRQNSNRRRQRQQTRQRRRQVKPHRRRPRRPPSLSQKILRCVGNVVGAFRSAFTRPTWERFVLLLFAAIMTTTGPTILGLLRTVDALTFGHASSFHRVLSRRRWSMWRLARAWAGYLVQRWLPTGAIPLAGDDTVFEHRGKKVYGKARHRDPVRSSHTFTAYRYGHKWVVLAVLVRFPWSHRPWALPVLVVLYRSKQDNQKQGRRHKTQPELMRQMLAVLLRWFPERRFVYVGDGGYGTHALTRFAQQQHQRLSLVSRFYPDANLYAPPPERSSQKKAGRPRVRGAKQPSPETVVQRTKRLQRLNVAWYGGGRRDIAIVSASGHWYKAGQGLTPVRWVYVKDRTGTHRDEYFYSSDLALSPQQIVETYTGRWNIETTFQEIRSGLKADKTRGWRAKTVLRAGPCLIGLYGVVAALYAELPMKWQYQRPGKRAGKKHLAFAQVLACVRRWLWSEWYFANPVYKDALCKIPSRLRAALLHGLAPAAQA